VLEHRSRLFLATGGRHGLDVPERADVEAGFRRAEIVRCDIAEQIIAAAQRSADGIHCGDETRVVRFDEADIGQQQQAGVQILAVVSVDEIAERRIPRARLDALVKLMASSCQ
jgi:hypothetical protein